MSTSQPPRWFSLSALFVAVISLSMFGVWLSHQAIFFTDFSLHATLETSCSILMLLLAMLIFKFNNNQCTLTHTHYVALALIGMSVINLLYAADDNENQFIWPHLISTLTGLILLLGVFVPERTVSQRLYVALPIVAAFFDGYNLKSDR